MYKKALWKRFNFDELKFTLKKIVRSYAPDTLRLSDHTNAEQTTNEEDERIKLGIFSVVSKASNMIWCNFSTS